MALKISTSEGTYDSAPDFKAEFELTNPFFTDKGSQTVATTVPDTDNNRKLTGYANRTDKAEKIGKKPVTVTSGVFIRNGLQAVNGISPAGINISIGLDEGEMYAKMSKMKLNELPDLPVSDYGTPENLASHLNDVMLEEVAADYEVFPVIISYQEHENKTYIEWLNEVSDDPSWKMLLRNKRTKDFLVSGTPMSVTVPAGYGISPFLKVSTVLRLIYSNFGYNLETNDFDTHFQLKKLVVLNNCADTIVKGKIVYRQLMPDAGVSDFLTALWVRFGVKIFIDSNTRTAKAVFIKDRIKSLPAEDWSALRDELPEQTFTAYKQLKLLASKSLEGAKTECDTYKEFLGIYNHVVNELINIDSPGGRFLRHYNDSGEYCIFPLNSQGEKFVSSSFFDWDQRDDLEYEELTSPDECVPMKYVTDTPMLLRTYPAYLTGANHLNTTLNTKESVKDNAGTAKLALCYKLGEIQYPNGIWSGYFAGSVFCKDIFHNRNYIDRQGREFQYSLTFHDEYGAFKQFHAGYDAMLRHAFQPVTQKLNLNKEMLTSQDLSTLKMIDNQPYFVENVKFAIGDDVDKTTVTLRATRLRMPYDLTAEQAVPNAEEQKYFWKLVSEEADKSEEVAASIKADITSCYRVDILYDQREYIIAPDESEAVVLPPNKDEYDGKSKINIQNCRVKQIFRAYMSGINIRQYVREIDFRVWFEPALL
ncbi:MAG: hypothetical protein FWF54_01610 [Candidatus Azobacteroides sp.]|nr:hypothetical protein [Candidatus Azobacteroides sp.]